MMRTFCLLAVAMLLQSPLRAQAQRRNLTQFLEETVSAERCAPADKRAGMIKAVQSRFADRALAVVDDPALPAAQAVAEVVTAGCMRSLAPARTAGLALAAYGAVMRGAHPGVVRAIASYGLDKDVSEERIRAWADGYAQMTAGRVPAEAASEAVRNALDNGWSDKTFNEVKWGLVHAAKSGFDLKDFSSFVFARMLKDKTRPGAAVAEAQAAFAKAKADGKKPAVPAYQGLFIPFVQQTGTPEAAAAAEAPTTAGPKTEEAALSIPRKPVKPAGALCVPTSLEIRADSPKAPAAPLKSALASHPDACKVELAVQAGQYPGDLEITADTVIRGRSGAAPVIKGSIKNLSGKFLLLENLVISGGSGKGVEQSGGKLFMRKVSVNGVEGTSDIESGRGVIVRGGAEALLVDVTLEGNAGGGLLTKDDGTRVHAIRLTAQSNRALPAVTARYRSSEQFDLLGAIEFSSRAMFFGENLVVGDNQGIGISLRDQSLAHIKRLRLSGTRKTTGVGKPMDGFNVFMRAGSQLELSDFKVTDAGSVGLALFSPLFKGRDGTIERNPVGMTAPEGLDLDRCFTNVTNDKNEANYSVLGTMPIPAPDGTSGSASSCPGVQWREAPPFP